MKFFFYWALALFFVAFSVYTADFKDSRNWTVLGFVLYSLPLLMLIFRVKKFRYSVFVLTFFLVAQSIIPSLFRAKYYTLQPNYHWATEYEEGAATGMHGIHHLTTDHKGYRVTKKIDYNSRSPGFRVFTIGGSTTEMNYMDDRKTWSALLQESLSKKWNREVEVINAALSGVRAEHNLATLKHVRNYHPDLVIILTGANDWRRDLYDHFYAVDGSPIPSEHRFANDRFFLEASLIGKMVAWMRGQLNHSLVEHGLKKVKPDVQYQNPNRPQWGANCKNAPVTTYFPREVSKNFAETLEEIKTICQKGGFACMLMNQPIGYRDNVTADYKRAIECNTFETPKGNKYNVGFETMKHITELYNDHVIKVAQNGGLFYCDLSAKIEPSFENFFDDAHYNEHGSVRVAEEVFKCVDSAIQQRVAKNAAIH